MDKSLMGLLGVVMIVIGVVGLIWGGISWTQKEEVLDLGAVEIEAEERESIPLPPLLGGLALAGGVVLVAASRKRDR